MTRSTFSCVGTTLAQRVALSAALLTPLALFSQPLRVGKSVLVSSDMPTTWHYEVTMCADPKTPGHLVAGSMMHNAENWIRNSVVYASNDGGKTWKKTIYGPLTADPACSFSDDGQAYMTLMKLNKPMGDFKGVDVYHSVDGGMTWRDTTRVSDGFVDRQWTTTGQMGSPYAGYFFMTASDYGKIGGVPATTTLYTSTPGGTNFFPSVASPPGKSAYHNGGVAALSDGTVVASYFDLRIASDSSAKPPGSISKMWVIRSTDGGRSFEEPIGIATGFSDYPGHGDFVSTDHIATLASDRTKGVFKDRLYLVWTDLKRGGRASLFLSLSSDKGKTWTLPRPIDGSHPYNAAEPWKGPHNVNPCVEVNKDGVVAISWMDRQNNSKGGYWPVMIVSFDGGMTWSAPMHVSETSPRGIPGPRNWHAVEMSVGLSGNKTDSTVSFMYDTQGHAPFSRPGDTSGLSADATGVFFPLWIDDRSGIWQIRTAPVTANGKIVTRQDVTDSVRIMFGKNVEQPGSHVVTTEVHIVNISHKPIQGPLTLDVLELGGDTVGTTLVLNADNKRDNTGATWDFALPDGAQSLAPNGATKSRTISLRYPAKMPAFGTAVEFKARVLATEVRTPAR